MIDNSFDARATFSMDDSTYEIFRLDRADGSTRLPFSLQVGRPGRLVTAARLTVRPVTVTLDGGRVRRTR